MNEVARVPKHLWIVGVIAVLWNAYGCLDYILSQTNNAAYLAQMTEEQRAYSESLPTWIEAAWAVGVWGGMLGAVLLLLRSRWAVTAFGLSLAGLALATLYNYALAPSPPPGMDTPGMIFMQLLIWAGCIFFLVYAARMRRAGVLR